LVSQTQTKKPKTICIDISGKHFDLHKATGNYFFNGKSFLGDTKSNVGAYFGLPSREQKSKASTILLMFDSKNCSTEKTIPATFSFELRHDTVIAVKEWFK
jgi:hypothetical protein